MGNKICGQFINHKVCRKLIILHISYYFGYIEAYFSEYTKLLFVKKSYLFISKVQIFLDLFRLRINCMIFSKLKII